jgi:ABC-type transport system substrate-binding protein
MYTGLTDIDYRGNIVPGIAESWEPNKDLTAWVFRLRKGVLFHNGRAVDAEAVKLNILRINNPVIGSDWHRGAVETIESMDVLDKYTVCFNLSMSDVAMPSSVMPYPTNLIAPESFANTAEHPIGTGPSKCVSWTRFNETRLVRFEDYWETEAEGNNLPYLDEINGLISGNTLRFDPNDFYGRNLHSKSEYAQVMSGWQHARYDQLVEEARRTLDPARRKALKDYQPNVVGALTYRDGGFRTAFIEAS